MKITTMFLGAAVALVATTLKADTLYWQVADNSMGEFTYATLYFTESYGSKPGTAITSVFADGVNASNYTTDFGTKVSPLITDIGTDKSSYFFYVEVTNYAGESRSLNEDYPWSYTQLLDSGYISTGSGIATPSVYATGAALNGGAVPEPTSGLLMLIGGSLLALRRRRQS